MRELLDLDDDEDEGEDEDEDEDELSGSLSRYPLLFTSFGLVALYGG
jgi:hypothetical protein